MGPDILGGIGRGVATGNALRQFQRGREMDELFAQHGPGILAGDQNALRELARVDPMAAFRVQSDRESMGLRRQEFDMRAKEYAATLDARTAAKEAEELRQGLTEAAYYYQRGDKVGYQGVLTKHGLDPREYPFEQFESLAPTIEGLIGVLEHHAGPQPEYKYQNGQWFEVTPGQAPRVADVPGMVPDEPESVEALRIRAIESGLRPNTDEYRRFMRDGGKPPQQSRAVFGADGKPVYFEGEPAALSGFGTKAENDMQERTINAAASLGRLTDTQSLYKPEYLEYETRFGNSLNAIRDKMGSATPEQQAALAEYTRFRAEAFNNLNTSLKELSGAAVTPQEAERLLEQLPNVGTGVLDGDSPTQFKAKLEQSILMQKRAIARYNIWRATGGVGHPSDLGSLDDVDSLINRRGKEIETDLREMGITDAAVIKRQVSEQLKKETGL